MHLSYTDKHSRSKALTPRVLSMIHSKFTLTLYGEAGVGKSAFLFEEIVPALTRKSTLGVLVSDWDAQEGLDSQVRKALEGTLMVPEQESLLQALRAARLRSDAPIVFILDQFESLLKDLQPEEVREKVFNLLYFLDQIKFVRTRIVFVLREEFFGLWWDILRHAPRYKEQFLRIPYLSASAKDS